MRALLSVTPKPILVVLLFVPIVAMAQEYHGPKCLGAFCVDRDVSAEILAERLGPLSKDFSVYKSPDGRTFLGVMGRGDASIARSISARPVA